MPNGYCWGIARGIEGLYWVMTDLQKGVYCRMVPFNLFFVFVQCSLLLLPLNGVFGVQNKLTASDAASKDLFGKSVAIANDGRYALVAAEGDDNDYVGSFSGSVYVFFHNGSSWSQQGRLVASDATATSYFGSSVSISSDGMYALIGAYEGDPGSGSAYVFVRNVSEWTQQEKLTATDASLADYFGFSVSISDDGMYALVGAYGDDDSGSKSGSAYLFFRNESSWSQQEKLTAPDATWSDYFGYSVSISHDGMYAIVGAYGNLNGETSGVQYGSAYVFVRNVASWSLQEKLTASDAARNDQFGYSVSISDDGMYALVGAPGDDDMGSAYVFVRNFSWRQQEKMVATDPVQGDDFGWSVSISNDGMYALIGAQKRDDHGSNSGSAYVFVRNCSWIQQEKLTANDASAFDFFGCSVSISSDGMYALVGAYGDDDDGDQSGSAYAFGTLAVSTTTSSCFKTTTPSFTSSTSFATVTAPSTSSTTVTSPSFTPSTTSNAVTTPSFTSTSSKAVTTPSSTTETPFLTSSTMTPTSYSFTQDTNTAVTTIFPITSSSASSVMTQTSSITHSNDPVSGAVATDQLTCIIKQILLLQLVFQLG